MILPKNDALLKKSIMDRATYMIKKDEYLPYDIEISLVRIIEGEIDFTNNLNYNLYNVRVRSDFNFIDSFSYLDENKLNYITLKK